MRTSMAIRSPAMASKRLDRRRLLLGLSVASVIALGWRPSRAAPTADQARTLIEGVSAEVLAILSDDTLSDREKLDRLVVVLNGPIDLDLAARLILGRNWKIANDDQREQYLELFRAYALANLASKLNLYRGQKFEVVGAQTVGKKDALVTSRILNDGQPPLQVDWRLRERDDGRLIAIDLIVEGVSLIVTLRSEFGSVIERQGFDGLLAELRQRIKQQQA